MKKSSSSDLVKPFLAVILVTVGVPVFTHAAMTSEVTQSLSAESSTSLSEDLEYNRFEPRSLQYDLFDAQEFVQMRRERRIPVGDVVPAASENAPEQTSSSVAPCDQTQSSSSQPVSQILDYYSQLSDTQRRDLRLQLRIGACPFDADTQYRLLCEAMLKAQTLIHQVQVGPRNPQQTQDQFLRSGGDISQ